ncbi:MAG: tetratricopeptide repeat protein, partial [Methylococcaceae bacterium]
MRCKPSTRISCTTNGSAACTEEIQRPARSAQRASKRGMSDGGRFGNGISRASIGDREFTLNLSLFRFHQRGVFPFSRRNRRQTLIIDATQQRTSHEHRLLRHPPIRQRVAESGAFDLTPACSSLPTTTMARAPPLTMKRHARQGRSPHPNPLPEGEGAQGCCDFHGNPAQLRLHSMHKNFRRDCDGHQAITHSTAPGGLDIAGWLRHLATLPPAPGQMGAALDSIRRALEETPDDPSLWAQLAQLGQRHFAPELVRQAAQNALALTEHKTGAERAQALVAMAGVARESEALEQAEQYYRQALQHCADHLPAHLGLGDLLLQWGRVDEAVALFEATVKLNPVAGYGALIDARRFPDDPKILVNIEKIALLPSLAGPVRTSLLFKLASAWEHHQDYAKAFQLAQQANAANRQLLTYRAEDHRRLCNRIRQTFTAEFFAARSGFGHASTLPVFVLGMPRSGTTLVEQIIGGHPDIHGAGEIGITSGIAQFLEQAERHTGSRRVYPECVHEVTARQSTAFAEKILQQLRAMAPAARHVVDKLPHNF